VRATIAHPGKRDARWGALAVTVLAMLAGAAAPVGCARSGQPGKAQAAASASPEASPEPGVIAVIGGEAIPYRVFERYLADNGIEDSAEGDQDATIKSRLLDQFVEEQLLLRAGKDLKVTVSDAEVDSYLEQIGVTEGEAESAGGEGKQAFRDKVRQGLILQKVKDEAVLSKVQVSPGEIDDYLKKQPDLLRTPRTVVLRQILVDDKSVADRLHTTLAADPSRFEAVARESSVSPDRGQARTYTEEELPVELRGPIFSLQPGQVSPVLENAQRYLLFQLVRKEEQKEADPAEVRRHVQLELFQSKGEQALERYLADLKKDTTVRVNRAVLPFEYAGEYKN
jgi:peptidyl-prolyl cis-trans isomerase SurA